MPTAYVDGIPLRNLRPMVANKSQGPYTADEQWNLARWARYSRVMVDGFSTRARALPPGANRAFIDRYSKGLFVPPTVLPNPTPSDIAMRIPVPVDEYGRLQPGKYGGPASFSFANPAGLWESTIGGLYRNPLGRAVINAAIVAGTGGAGVAVMGAYALWENRARELSVKNVALQTARAYAVSQCGEACGMAFDFGVGVADGKDVDEAALDAVYAQMTPEQRATYDDGKRAYERLHA